MKRDIKIDMTLPLILFLGFCYWVFSSSLPDLGECMSGVPSTIMFDAVRTPGFLPVALYGTDRERHEWAKGHDTQFGHLSYDADDYLKYNRHWSEVHIHDVGHAYRFSPLWGNRGGGQ